MLKDGKFVISFTDLMDDGPLGIAFGDTRYTVNYYLDNSFRATMCCNCDKGPRT